MRRLFTLLYPDEVKMQMKIEIDHSDSQEITFMDVTDEEGNKAHISFDADELRGLVDILNTLT